MTVKEFINLFSEEDMNKELFFTYSLMVISSNNTTNYGGDEFDEIYHDETEEYYFDRNVDTKNIIVVDL